METDSDKIIQINFPRREAEKFLANRVQTKVDKLINFCFAKAAEKIIYAVINFDF